MTGMVEPFTRNGRGQPLIPDPITGKPIPYQRVSTFASTLDDKSGLMTWYAWQSIKGSQVDQQLAARIAGASTAPRQLIETLIDQAGGNEARNKGTARHAIVADTLNGKPRPTLTTQANAELDAVLAVIHQLGTLIGTEIPIVNDDLAVAGSCDYLLRAPDGRPVVADLKTGKTLSILNVAIQLAAYARGVRWIDGQRGPLVADQLPHLVAIHAPQDDPLNVQAIHIDPQTATAWAHLAQQVRHIRRNTKEAIR